MGAVAAVKPGSTMPVSSTELKWDTFRKLAGQIQTRLGVRMPDSKKRMLEARLVKQMHSHQAATVQEYAEEVLKGNLTDHELSQFVDAVTTHHTFFLREPVHFEWLAHDMLPEFVTRPTPVHRRLQMWSAGCSTGEEAYGMCMVAEEFRRTHPAAHLDYTVLGTDVSARVLDHARLATFDEQKADGVPGELKRRYLLRSRDRSRALVRVVRELRKHVEFRVLNLVDAEYGIRQQMHLIFFRNVIIYFDRPTQRRIVERMCDILAPGGHLVLALTESLLGLELPLKPDGPSIYRRL